jgi:hypothetical protein
VMPQRRHLNNPADLLEGRGLGDQLLGGPAQSTSPSGWSWRMIDSAVCLVRVRAESQTQPISS